MSRFRDLHPLYAEGGIQDDDSQTVDESSLPVACNGAMDSSKSGRGYHLLLRVVAKQLLLLTIIAYLVVLASMKTHVQRMTGLLSHDTSEGTGHVQSSPDPLPRRAKRKSVPSKGGTEDSLLPRLHLLLSSLRLVRTAATGGGDKRTGFPQGKREHGAGKAEHTTAFLAVLNNPQPHA